MAINKDYTDYRKKSKISKPEILSEFQVAEANAENEDLEQLCHLQSVLREEGVDLKKHRLIHVVLMVVAREGFVDIEDIPTLALRHFKIPIVCTDWGFKDMVALVQDFVLKDKQHSEVIDYKCFDFKREEGPNSSQIFSYSPLKRHFYLIGKRLPEATERFKDFRRLHENYDDVAYAAAIKKAMAKFQRPRFPKYAMTNLEDALYVSDFLPSGFITNTICTGCLTPSNFCVVMETHLSRHKHVYNILQDERKNKKWFDYKPSEDCVCLGQIVLVSSPSLDPENPEAREWSRGKVVRIIKREEEPEEETVYRVRQLDFGSDCFESVNNIRLAPRQLMEETEVLAICCRLAFDDPEFEKKSKRGIWSQKEIELFRNFVLNKLMIVNFKQISNIYGYSSRMRTNPAPITDCSYSKRLPKDATFVLPLRDKRRWDVSVTVKTRLNEDDDDEEDKQEFVYAYSDLATTFLKMLEEIEDSQEK